MKISEIIDGGNYTIFKRMGNDNRTDHIMVINYIQNLAGSSGADISDWDIMALFGKGSGNELYKDKREINSRFFQEFRNRQSAAVATDISQRIQNNLKNHAMRLIQRKTQELQSRKDTYLRSAKDYYNSYENYVKEAFNAELEIRTMAGRPIDFGSQVNAIVAERFWNLINVTDTAIVFETANDIVCREVNKAARVDISVNLGKFKATLDMTSMSLKVNGSGNNINLAGRDNGELAHPHVRTGNICWGNAQSTVQKQLSMGELIPVFRLLASLLTTYNGDNPYASLAVFKEVEITRANAGASTGPIAAANSFAVVPTVVTVSSDDDDISF